MSRPPPSIAYPPIPRGAPPLPPFPQLMHMRDDSSIQGTPHSDNVDSSGPALSPEEEDELDDGAPNESPVTGTGGKKDKDKKPHATRRRVVQSCSECRRRKIKCDKKFPCGPCILRSDQARCHEVGMAEKTVVSSPNNFATAAELTTVAHRLDALEASLLKSGAVRSADLEHFLKVVRGDEPGPSSRRTSRVIQPAQALSEEETVDDTEGAALTLEHLAFGRSRADGSHALPHFGARLSSVSRPAPNNDYHLAKSNVQQPLSPSALLQPLDSMTGGRKQSVIGMPEIKPRFSSHGGELSTDERTARIEELIDLIGPTDVFEMFYRKTDIAMKALSRLLPSRERGELLVRAYLEKVDWLHRCIHVPTFLRQCNDLWCLPPDRVVSELAMPFVALYFTVLTLGLQFMDISEISKHFTVDEAHTLPDTWFNAARSALWAADFVGSHTLESLQCIIQLGVFMNNRDRADAAWALLGAAIKMAQGLGLSRLGAEQQSVDGKPLPMWTGRWESLIQREVGRRVWWNLVFLDWSLAPSYNFSCSIQPDQIKTALPANVEDEDILDNQPLKPQPLHVRTGMSFQLARLRFAEITQRQIWQANNNNHPPYSFILSVDGELRKAMMELPAFFQPDSNNRGPPSHEPKALVQYYEKIMLNLAVHSRMLRLHRPWLSRGYTDERFAYSKEQCIRASRATLRMMSDSDGTAAFLEKWWLPLFYVSVSGLVVIIDLLRTARRDMYSADTEEKIAEVNGALDQMRRIADVSHPSRAAVKVMDFLMAEVEDRRKPPGSTLGKRKTENDEDDSNLQRAVKKLIRQAQLEADSPNTSIGSVPGATPPSHAVAPSPRPALNERDRDRERPVFDAYPMPFNPVPPTITNATTPTPALQQNQQQPQPSSIVQNGTNDPFTFPINPNPDPFSSFDNRNFGFNAGGVNAPQLDPAVESMLASYFPVNVQTSGGPVGSAAVPQAPEDFLTRVFGFGWDGSPHQPPINGPHTQQPQGQGQGQGQVLPQQQQQIQQQQFPPPQGGVPNQSVGQNGFGGGYGGWSNHSWMA